MENEKGREEGSDFTFKNLKENSFVLPDKYFDELPHLIGSRVGSEKTKSLFWSWGVSTAVACVLVIGFVLVETEKEEVDFYAESIVETYTNEELSDVFEEEEVIDFLTDVDYN